MVIIAGGSILVTVRPSSKQMLREGEHCTSGHRVLPDQCTCYLENSAQRERRRRKGQAFGRHHRLARRTFTTGI